MRDIFYRTFRDIFFHECFAYVLQLNVLRAAEYILQAHQYHLRYTTDKNGYSCAYSYLFASYKSNTKHTTIGKWQT